MTTTGQLGRKEQEIMDFLHRSIFDAILQSPIARGRVTLFRPLGFPAARSPMIMQSILSVVPACVSSGRDQMLWWRAPPIECVELSREIWQDSCLWAFNREK